jgi:hypothetical protein
VTKLCMFLGSRESINHIFFCCYLTRFIWNVINIANGFRIVPSSLVKDGLLYPEGD